MAGYIDIIWGCIKGFLNWFTSKPSILFGIAVACIVVLALPEPWRIYLGYDELIKPIRGWISLVALVSGVLWLVAILTKFMALIYSFVGGQLENWWFRRKAPKILYELSRQEKQYVAKYIKNDVTTLKWSLEAGVIEGLRAKHVVYLASRMGRLSGFAFTLQPWVTKALEKHSDLKDDILKHYEEEFIRI